MREREKEGRRRENLYFQLGDSDSWRRTIEKPFARSSAPAPLFSEVISYIECSVARHPHSRPSLAGAGGTSGGKQEGGYHIYSPSLRLIGGERRNSVCRAYLQRAVRRRKERKETETGALFPVDSTTVTTSADRINVHSLSFSRLGATGVRLGCGVVGGTRDTRCGILRCHS